MGRAGTGQRHADTHSQGTSTQPGIRPVTPPC